MRLAGIVALTVLILMGGQALFVARWCGCQGMPQRIEIVVDTSGSMSENDKIVQARQAIREFAKTLPAQMEISIRGFNEISKLVLPPVKVGEAKLDDALAALVPDDGTSIAAGLEGAHGDLSSTSGKVILIVVSDGLSHNPPQDIPVAEKLATTYKELEGHTVGIGMETAGMVHLQALAEKMRGKSFNTSVGKLFETLSSISLSSTLGREGLLGMAGRGLIYLVVVAGFVWALVRLRHDKSEYLYLGLLCGLGGVVAWVFTEPFKSDAATTSWLLELLANAIYFAVCGAVIGGAIMSAEGIMLGIGARIVDGLKRGARMGAIGGAIGAVVGQLLFATLSTAGPGLLQLLARTIGWALFGLALGIGSGLASPSRLFRASLGGLVGGALGGMFFDTFSCLMGGGGPARLVALAVIGACIGALLGLAEEMARECWVEIARGSPEGKKFRLDRDETVIGRNEIVEIPLIADPELKGRHARIVRSPEGFRVEQLEGPIKVNEVQTGARVLRDGDRIDLSPRYLLIFRSLARQGAAAPPPVPSDAGASVPPPVAAPPAPAATAFEGWGLFECRIHGQPESVIQATFHLEKDEVMVGSGAGCVCRFADETVAQEHALVKRVHGRVFVFDKSQGRTTQIDGQPVKGKTELAPGSQLRVGNWVLRLRVR